MKEEYLTCCWSYDSQVWTVVIPAHSFKF